MTTTGETSQQIADGKYALLTTFRKDGTPVPTAVWLAACDGGVGVWTGRNSGKAKRIRRDGRVTLATCDMRGRHAGPAVTAHAIVVDRADGDDIVAAISRKYGLLGRWYIRFSERGERRAHLACLRIT